MDCNGVNMRWNDYLEGNCLSSEEREIEEHLKTCPNCSYKLDSAIEDQNESFLAASYKNAIEHVVPLSSKAQKKLIFRAKWKNRLSNAITMFCLFIIVSIASGTFTGLFFGIGPEGGRGAKTAQVFKTATQMTMPNVFLQGVNQQTNFFFTMDLNTVIQKEIGKEYKTIGKFNGKLFFNQMNVERDWHASTYNVQLYFLHPHYIDNHPNDSDTYRSDMNDVWEALEILPEGTVAELAISFDDLYEIDDVYTILEDYDVNIPWYAVETGTEQNGDENQSPYQSAVNDIWGFHNQSVFDFSQLDKNSILERGDGQKRAQSFIEGLRFLTENEKIAKRYLYNIDRETSLSDRLMYVEEHGVHTYGVVVTGPTKELLRLQENEQVHYARLGDVDLWNWYHPSSGGTIY